MGRPDQGEWRFILIGSTACALRIPAVHTPLTSRDAPCRGRGSFRMRRFVVYTEGVVMSLAIKNLDAPLGAEISGLDLSKPIAPNQVRTIEDVWRERLVVVFHDQKLSDPQLIAFSKN